MSNITRDEPMFSDDDIERMARSIEPHDFERIAPPPQVWNNVLAELEIAVASEEASARRQSQSMFTPARILSLAAACVLIAALAVGGLALARSDVESFEELATAVMTDAELPVPTTETANAAVLCEENGDCFVQVNLTGLPEAEQADLELWVINGDVTDMHSLGLVTESGRFPLPDGVSYDDFPIVDISIEPRDGIETHSGQSVLRGVFEQT